jgi:type IV pilus assembly protein PilY1
MLALATVMALGVTTAVAEDIDLYEDGGGTSGVPNVLIILDNGANFDASTNGQTCSYADGSGSPGATTAGTLAAIEQCAIFNAVYSLPPGSINLGLMVFNQSQFSSFGCLGTNTGGCLIKPLELMTGQAKTDFLNFVKSWSVNKSSNNPNTVYMKSNSESTGSAMQEAWAYYAGKTGLSGRNYAGIQPAQGCQKNFVVYIGNAYDVNGTPGDGSVSGQGPGAALAAAPNVTQAQTSPITVTYAHNEACNASNPYYSMPNHSEGSGLWADEWARYMYGTDVFGNLDGVQNIRTYTIGVLGPSCKADYPALLTSMAGQGHGKYYSAYTYTELYQAFLAFLNEVQSVNSVFASSSLPVSVNNQGTYLNQVFIGMFRPDASAAPRWMGNLKQYQFGVKNTASGPQLFLADSLGNSAISAAGTGFISPTAVSFWTQKDTSKLPDNIGATGGFWINNPMGTPLSGFDSPDGEVVEKGAVGQQIRLTELTDAYSTTPNTPHNRSLYTCTSGTGLCAGNASLSATPFDLSNNDITTALLGASAPPVSVTNVSITHSSATASTASVTLGSAPNPALATGQTVTIAGSKYPELNGPYSITATGGTTFTYTPLATSPPSPATGSYTASPASVGASITSLSRSGTTATAVTSAPHGYVTGLTVTIASSSPNATNARYYGDVVVTSTPTPNSFTYTVQEGPATPSTGGTVTIGSKNYPISILSRTGTEVDVTITFSGQNPTGSTATISGTTVVAYNGTWSTTKKQGQACPAGSNGTTFCFTITTTPPSPDTDPGLNTYPNTGSVAISSLSRGTTVCSGTYTGQALVTATAQTSTLPGFAAGSTINVGGVGGVIGPNEALYTGAFTIQTFSVDVSTTPPTYTFTYYAPTSPGCTDTTSGMTAAPAGIDRDTMIRWVRGEDNQGDELGPGNTVTIRPSVHGDVLHSRPTVVNYGGSTGIVVFYGSNDGVLRAVNGNQTASIGTVQPGGELWGFIPREFFGKLGRLAYNSPALKLPNTPNGIIPAPQRKDYFFDGNSSVYQDGGTVYLFVSARRGGRLIYALDVSDPANPKFLWRKGCTSLTDNTTCDSGFTELGQTWSTPKAAKVKGYSNPVLIFGAGYHGGYDSSGNPVGEDAEPAATDTMGRGIFILDATNGSIVWQAKGGGSGNSCQGTSCTLADMTYSIPADITLLNRDFDANGYIDRLYAADTGGNIWRVDLEPSSGNTPSNWQVTKFASLGGSGSFKRKILAAPDVVVTKTFDIVLTGTGDREHPLYSSSGSSTYSVVNRFYALKDLKTGPDATPWTSADTIVDNSSSTSSDAPSPKTLFDATSTPYDNSLSGFYVILGNPGEKVVNGPTSVGGYAYFGTNQPPIPDSNSCKSNLGTALGYQVNLFTGAVETVTFDGGGLPPSPVAGLVSVKVNGVDTVLPFLLGGGNPSPTCEGPDCTSSIGGGKPPIPVPPVRRRVYWYMDKHDN